MKKSAALSAFMAMAMAMGTRSPYSSAIDPDDLQKAKYKPVKPKIIPKGCQEFKFEGFTCIAMNEASALKKYQKFLKHKK